MTTMHDNPRDDQILVTTRTTQRVHDATPTNQIATILVRDVALMTVVCVAHRCIMDVVHRLGSNVRLTRSNTRTNHASDIPCAPGQDTHHHRRNVHKLVFRSSRNRNELVGVMRLW